MQDNDLIEAYSNLSLGGFDDPHLRNNEYQVAELKTLWKNPIVQQVYNDRHKLFATFPGEGFAYFMNKIDEIKHDNYVITEKDWLYSTTYTMGSDIEKVRRFNTNLKLVTVGGRRIFRRGWNEHYEGSSCIVYVVSLPHFHNKDSLNSFKDLVNNEKLREIPVVLVLNKADLLRAEIDRHKFSSNFPSFTGSDNKCADIIMFLKDLYMMQYTGTEEAKIFPIVMHSMDPKMVEEVTRVISDVARKGTTYGQKFKMYDPDAPLVLFKEVLFNYHDISFQLHVYYVNE